MTWLLITCLALLSVVSLLLALPVSFAVEVSGTTHVRVRWLFGLVDTELGHARPTTKKVRKPRRGSWARLPAGIRRFTPVVARYLARSAKAVRTRELSGLVRIGLEDPAATGQLWAVVGPASVWLAMRHPAMAVEPDFTGATLEVNATGQVSIVPLKLIAITITFLLAPSTLRALAAARGTS